MNIQQLRYICELSRHALKISKVAEVLHTSQPNISTQLRLLEEELNLTIFQRQRRRLTAITPDGQRVIERAQRILVELNEIKAIGSEHLQEKSGTLVIAASHTQARFRLPAVLRRFREHYPDVHISIRPESGRAIRDALIASAADIGILSQAHDSDMDLAYIPFQSYRRLLLVCADHPLLAKRKIAFRDIIRYPVVLYEPSQTAEAITRLLAQLPPPGPSILRAANADIVKAYVEHGLGVSVLPNIVFDPERDTGLRAIAVDHIFPASTTFLALNRKHHLRRYAYSFIETLAPNVTREVVEKAMAAPRRQRRA
ncbi:HTH-type transcriptional regulator CysB [Pigmentiphaga soli]|uniref:HTH-type transcriptional regulator CysB n=1 Tax=Pigmentiphaga soli TaxID=1007095 RepID=A0ABP8GL70_9BURK